MICNGYHLKCVPWMVRQCTFASLHPLHCRACASDGHHMRGAVPGSIWGSSLQCRRRSTCACRIVPHTCTRCQQQGSSCCSLRRPWLAWTMQPSLGAGNRAHSISPSHGGSSCVDTAPPAGWPPPPSCALSPPAASPCMAQLSSGCRVEGWGLGVCPTVQRAGSGVQTQRAHWDAEILTDSQAVLCHRQPPAPVLHRSVQGWGFTPLYRQQGRGP